MKITIELQNAEHVQRNIDTLEYLLKGNAPRAVDTAIIIDTISTMNEIKIKSLKTEKWNPKCIRCGARYESGDCWNYRCSNTDCGYTPKKLG